MEYDGRQVLRGAGAALADVGEIAGPTELAAGTCDRRMPVDTDRTLLDVVGIRAGSFAAGDEGATVERRWRAAPQRGAFLLGDRTIVRMSTEQQDTETASEDRTVIHQGRDFEQTYRLRAADVGAFLVRLGEQLQDADELTVVDESGDEAWELPFAFGEPVELEIEYEGMDEPELEIEVEIPGRVGDEAPEIR